MLREQFGKVVAEFIEWAAANSISNSLHGFLWFLQTKGYLRDTTRPEPMESNAVFPSKDPNAVVVTFSRNPVKTEAEITFASLMRPLHEIAMRIPLDKTNSHSFYADDRPCDCVKCNPKPTGPTGDGTHWQDWA